MAAHFEPITDRVNRHRLIFAIIFAICIGLLLTVISMSLYISSGASRLDLSRPGYERVRQQVSETADTDTFASDGPLDSKAIDQFQGLFSKNRNILNKLDAYNGSQFNDDQLNLLPSSTTPNSN